MSRLLTGSEANYFRELTDRYVPNEEVVELFRQSNFAIIAGPAGAGKDTLRDQLIHDYPDRYVPILSTTTRPMRDSEQENVSYHFRTVEEVAEGLDKREFFQAQLVHDQQISCLHVDEISKLNSDQIGISILVVQTEEKLSEIKKDIRTIFIIPPSLDVLTERMQIDRSMDPNEIIRRLHASRIELQIALSSEGKYYCLVNDDIDDLEQHTRNYLEKGIIDYSQDAVARRIIAEILNALSV